MKRKALPWHSTISRTRQLFPFDRLPHEEEGLNAAGKHGSMVGFPFDRLPHEEEGTYINVGRVAYPKFPFDRLPHEEEGGVEHLQSAPGIPRFHSIAFPMKRKA